jgi:release factor glutamine methyltransferase
MTESGAATPPQVGGALLRERPGAVTSISECEHLAPLVTTLRAAGCVFAEDEAALLLSDNPTPAGLAAMVARRVAGEPIEHVLGWAKFRGRRYAVDHGVFVPRRRTEFLVDLAVTLASEIRRSGPVVVDLCCGAGPIGAAFAAAVPGSVLHAVDVDAAAVRCARRNLAAVSGQVYQGDLYAALPAELRGRVDLLLVNAPYVPTDEIRLMPTEAREFEPPVALDGGTDGLEIQRRVIVRAPQWLAGGGYLLIETSERQAPQTLAAFHAAGLTARVEHSGELDATVVLGARA